MKLGHPVSWLFSLALFVGASSHARPLIQGDVRDSVGTPIAGATVLILVDSGIVAGAATDADGRFAITVQLPDHYIAELRVHALGYYPASLTISSADKDTPFLLHLERRPLLFPSIQVQESPGERPQETLLEKSLVVRGAQRSHVGTNPVAALREPQLSRRGSSHSSTLRVNGSSPQYFVNGIGIGSDPNHYGLFSIVPVTMVERISFYPQGTPSRFSSPSVIDLVTPERFRPGMGGEAYLSLVEGTGSVWRGNERRFVLGSVRHSIVDMIANQIDMKGERSTIPPTTFRDFFLTGGMKHAENHESFFDGFVVADKLLYEQEATSLSRAVESHVQTSRYYFGLRTDKTIQTDRWKAGLSLSRSRESYVVNEDEKRSGNVYGNLIEHAVTANQFVSFERTGSITTLCMGADADWTLERLTRLEQHNWNFLPPDANSDNAFPYMQELNRLFGAYGRDTRALSLATHASATTRLGRWENESGLRVQYFSELRSRSTLVFRQRLAYQFSDIIRAELFAGSFAENPIVRILEPYQVIARADASLLTPVRTRLVSGRLVAGPVTASVFAKEITGVPALVPDFSRVNEQGVVMDGFLSMQSVGRTNFHGADIALSLPETIYGVDLFAYYGYTVATRLTHDIAVPYELGAPHRFLGEITYRPSRVLSLSSSLQLRTGYPYTPRRPNSLSVTRSERYSEPYYASALSRENSLRFSPYATVNLHGTVDFGRTELSCNLTNVTNRANPLVFTGAKYVYDLGIFPSLSLRVEF